MNIAALFATQDKLKYCALLDYDLIYIIDENPYNWNYDDNHQGVVYLPMEKAVELYKVGNIDKFYIFPSYKKNIRNFIDIYLKKYIKSCDILYMPMKIFRDTNLSFDDIRNSICPFEECRELEFLSIHISEQCNLQCKNCSMLIGACENPAEISFEETKAALQVLKNIVDDIGVIQLIGGEPLLNNRILDFCVIIRENYPLSEIEIITNGTLINNMDALFFNTIKSLNIKICVSHYPVLKSKADSINEILKSNNVIYDFSDEYRYFSKLYNLIGNSDIKKTFEVCRSMHYCKNGLNLKGKFLAPCMAPFALENIAEYYGIKVENHGIVNLLSKNLSLNVEEILMMLSTPLDICRYCHCDTVEKWHQLYSDQMDDILNWSV